MRCFVMRQCGGCSARFGSRVGGGWEQSADLRGQRSQGDAFEMGEGREEVRDGSEALHGVEDGVEQSGESDRLQGRAMGVELSLLVAQVCNELVQALGHNLHAVEVKPRRRRQTIAR